MAKIRVIKPMGYTGFRDPKAKLVYGEIPRRIVVRGKTWTWRNQPYMGSYEDEAKRLRKEGYLTMWGTVKGQRQLYFRKRSK